MQDPIATNSELTKKPPVSQDKIDANRRNAEFSTGPRSPEGKRRSSLNALRSGLHGAIVCLTAEDLAAFTSHCDAIRAQLAPDGPLEAFYATSIAENMFRAIRARSLENSVFASGFRQHVDSIHSGHPEVDAALAQSETFLREAHQLHLLTVYESRLSRLISRDTATLQALQAERKTAHARALQEARQLSKLAAHEGYAYDPADDFEPPSAHGGFVFSTQELQRFEDRQNRLDRASKLVHNRERAA
ncbi:MAG TPA: hypothetical protein VHW24_16395 [Bryobacteraceae bacterium]|nr:hypothetical protein [Bryobacteraceae bacterium]